MSIFLISLLLKDVLDTEDSIFDNFQDDRINIFLLRKLVNYRKRVNCLATRIFFKTVLRCLVMAPQGVRGLGPPEVFPRPPPCGWSIAFIATPRVVGRLPKFTRNPALRRIR